jgi:protein arginine N-methyltransferase 3
MSDSDSDIASSAGSILEDASEPDVSSFQCLFCDETYNDTKAMFVHVEDYHSYAIRDTIKSIATGTGLFYAPPLRPTADHVNKSSKR